MERQIDLVLKFYDSNRLNYENLIIDAKLHNSIMPFVGEDLIKNTFGSRNDFISEVQRKTPRKSMNSNTVIDNDKMDFLEILDLLIQIHKPRAIEQQLLSFYSDAKIDDRYLRNQAISLIPYINGNHCITANFDHAIDHSYDLAGKTPDVTHPYERKKLNMLVRNSQNIAKVNIILKIHGDILSDKRHRILTKSDYQSHYNCSSFSNVDSINEDDKTSTFYHTLSQWLQYYTILFIGVDICKDVYLFNLIQNIHSEGETHYAIIGCKDDAAEKSEIYGKLNSIGISAILFDIDKPESLQILLHKFLLDTNNIPSYPQGEIDYQYTHQDLIGRENQIQKLKSFLIKDDRFLWTIIRGNRLTGRTKLVYDFSRLYASDWEWYVLEPEEIDDFLKEQERIQNARKKDRKLLVTFDNFHWFKGELDKLFNSKGCMNLYNTKIRFIFVVYDVKQSSLWKTLKQKNHDDFWTKIMSSADRTLPIDIEPLSVDEIFQLCHSYLYYRAFQLGIDQIIEKVFSYIDEELLDFIKNLYNLKRPDILFLSQMKALNLVKKYNGDDYLSDEEFAEALFEMTITNRRLPSGHKDIDYDLWMIDDNERRQISVDTKEFFKNKEKIIDSKIQGFYEDSEMSSMLSNLGFDNYKSN